MKKRIQIMLIMLCGFLGLQAKVVTDTVTRLNHPDWVEIKEYGDSIRINVSGEEYGQEYYYTYSSASTISEESDWEINLPFIGSYTDRHRKRKKSNWVSVDWFDNFYIGGVIGIDKPEGMRGGWEIGVDNIVGIFWHTGRNAPVISLGAGMGYRSTNFGNGMMLSQEGKCLTVVPIDEEINSASSRLHLLRLSVPLMITQPLGCGIALKVGGILNLNTYTSATTKIKSSRWNGKVSFHSLEQRFATPDIFGSLILCDNFGVYVRWSPVPLFQKQWGPEFRIISVGVNFVL